MNAAVFTFFLRSTGSRLIAAAALALGILATPAFAQSPPVVQVSEKEGLYTVAARFTVDQSPAVVLSVLTDYERIPQMLPDVRTSVVKHRLAGRAVVEQEAVSRLMMFSKRVHLVLEVDEQPDAVLFHDSSGTSFSRYDGAWRLTVVDGVTAISYELVAKPTFDVPGFMLSRLLRRDSKEMIERLKAAIQAARPRTNN